MKNKTKLFLMVCINLLIASVCIAQTNFDDNITIKQVNSKYPGLRISTFDELHPSGHSYLLMQNFGGTNANPLATQSNSLLGTIIYGGYDGEKSVQVGRISVNSYQEFSSGNHPARMNFQIGGTTACCGINRMTIDGQTGNVGIGITNPLSKLHIRGDELGQSIDDQSILTTIEGNVAGNNSKFQILNKRNVAGKQWTNTSLRLQRVVDVTPMAFIDFGIEGKASNYGLAFGTRDRLSNAQTVRMIIEDNGNVGIGTTDTKGYKLAVAGKIITEEVKVQLKTDWPDYVFDQHYSLPSLEETENYIKENGHLQNIPNAEEVAKEGLSLGEMNARLLQKIEELTLYTINQDKQIKQLEQILDAYIKNKDSKEK